MTAETASNDVLAQGYRRARAITCQHATTYFWGTQLLDSAKRPHVYAVYALCRLADDIVDNPLTPGIDAATALRDFHERFMEHVRGQDATDPVLAAAANTVDVTGIPLACFDRFFAAMTLDLTQTTWDSWEHLRDEYMEGSAAVIGEMMLPVLRPLTPQALHPARNLGLAFQLTNFLRDVGEDLDRGRLYLPADELAAFGVDPWARSVTPQWKAFLAKQIQRNRALYADAETGVAMLPPDAARCVGAAIAMYQRILVEIEDADYDVFTRRVRVPGPRKTALVTTRLARSALPDIDSPLRVSHQPPPQQLESTWREAMIPRIEEALRRSQQRDPGGWHVIGASADIGRARSELRVISGREITVWRDGAGALRAGPGACPHMGAALQHCPVAGDQILCRWHGLALPHRGLGWQPIPAYDDGVLVWVNLPTLGEVTTSAPVVAARPPLDRSVIAVVARPAVCEPQDIVANRLDPWHGSWLHPQAFSHLRVDEAASTPDRLVTEVTFRLGHRFGVPVVAEFSCPDARTIAMHITDGEGAGSVVETHATALGTAHDGLPRTMMTEATIAYSPRRGFQASRPAAPLIAAGMRQVARRLWDDDLAYAQRRYLIRRSADF